MNEQKILIVGSGGREYELVRQMSGSSGTSVLYVADGNAGTAKMPGAQNVDVTPSDLDGVCNFVQDNAITLVIVGPEAPLVVGLADRLRQMGVAVFGPGAQAARLEGDKAFAADFMQRHGIAQPASQTARSLDEALQYISDKEPQAYVLKASGLAGGKGVVLPESAEEARQVLSAMFTGEGFDGAGKEGVVIQERLHGPEVSAFVVTDGTQYVMLPLVQDHKRLGDNDTGPNTGGMGTYAPVPDTIVQAHQRQKIEDIASKTIAGITAEGISYQGVVFIGLMLAEERDGDPVVIEYNIRFGDPETEVLLPVLSESGLDVAQLITMAAKGGLGDLTLPAQYSTAALSICLAAEGYPEKPRKGEVIHGLEKSYENVIIHYAGTKLDGDRVVTAGGRVLYVTGLGNTIDEAAAHAYAAIGPQAIHFTGMQFRKDIGHQSRQESLIQP